MRLKPPACIGSGPWDDARDDAELVHSVQIELDLIKEGQEGTAAYTRRDVAAIRRWLQKHGAKVGA